MKYLKRINSRTEYDRYMSTMRALPNVCYIVEDGQVIYNKSSAIYDLPLFFDAIRQTTISFSGSIWEYSYDNELWESATSAAKVTLNAGGRLYARARDLTPTSSKGIGNFLFDGECNVGGNIMSMKEGADYMQSSDLQAYQFVGLFRNANVVRADTLALPTKILNSYCYQYMFYNCANLVAAPELPATTLADYCYQFMFSYCANLVAAPELPATTLKSNCYSNMFINCRSLVTAPKLPATTLANNCYSGMFGRCINLIYAPELPAKTLANYCYSGMFNGCENLTSAPILSATSLKTSCYQTMLYGCKSLQYIRMTASNVTATNCLSEWVNGVGVNGTFVKASGVTIPTGTSGIPEGWTIQEI